MVSFRIYVLKLSADLSFSLAVSCSLACIFAIARKAPIMKRTLLLLPCLFISFLSLCQSKLLTIEDAMVRNRTTLAPANLKQMQFVFGTEDYVYLKKEGDKDVWVKGNFNKASEESFLTLDELNTLLANAGREPLTAMPMINFSKAGQGIISTAKGKLAYNTATKKFTTLISADVMGKVNVEESSAGYVAYTSEGNLFVNYGGYSKQVTTDGSSDIVYASSVHRDEFGIRKGTFWSNNGKQLAFYRMDQSMVADYPLINWKTEPATVTNIKYPMAGGKSHHVTVGVYNAETGRVVYLQTGEPADQYLTNVAWGPDDKHIYIAIVNRAQDNMKLNAYDAATGAFIKTVFEESNNKYVEPQVPVLFLPTNSNHFIWQSFRDGYNHLYLYDTNGKLLKQLTNGKWNVTEVKGFDAAGENLFYVSTQESPLSRHLYSLDIRSGKIKRITETEAVHTTQVSSSGKFVLDNFTSATTPRAIRLIETASGKSKTIFTAPHPLEGYALGSMNIFTLTGKSGDALYCRMFKPSSFDSTKKYPVIVYWYGGTHSQTITAGFNGGASDYWFQYMAQQGFVVFSIDVRGSANRGMAFEQSIFRKAGEAQMEDLLTGVDYLHALPYVDRDNMGLFGWSYGGFLTINTMLTRPTVFKAAVAGGPVTDWSLYEVMYTERYMDTPQENPLGYEATDLSKRVDKLQGKLLLIHGLQDPVVVQQHSVKFVNAAIDKKVQVDYMIYPNHEHNVLGKDRAHLYQKVTDYFMLHLRK